MAVEPDKVTSLLVYAADKQKRQMQYRHLLVWGPMLSASKSMHLGCTSGSSVVTILNDHSNCEGGWITGMSNGRGLIALSIGRMELPEYSSS